MEKKKYGELPKFLLMLVLVLLMAFMGYKFLCKPLMEEKAALQEENFALNSRLIELTNKAINTQKYKDDIAKSKEQIATVLAKYSAGNTPEKSIMLIGDLEKGMETVVGVEIPNISFSEPVTLTNVQMPMVTDTGEEGANSYAITYYNVSLLSETISMSYTCTYDELKKMSDFINSYPERMNIKSIAVSYDGESGDLTGSMVLNLYAVTGTDKTYTDPVIEDIRLGESNIFAQ